MKEVHGVRVPVVIPQLEKLPYMPAWWNTLI
jgi:hypothetical protein